MSEFEKIFLEAFEAAERAEKAEQEEVEISENQPSFNLAEVAI